MTPACPASVLRRRPGRTPACCVLRPPLQSILAVALTSSRAPRYPIHPSSIVSVKAHRKRERLQFRRSVCAVVLVLPFFSSRITYHSALACLACQSLICPLSFTFARGAELLSPLRGSLRVTGRMSSAPMSVTDGVLPLILPVVQSERRREHILRHQWWGAPIAHCLGCGPRIPRTANNAKDQWRTPDAVQQRSRGQDHSCI